jgi:hypothetical protein
MTTTVERSYVDHRYEHEPSTSRRTTYDLTGQLLRGGQRDAEHAKRGIVLVYSRIDDQHSQVSLQPQAGVASEEMLTEAIERLATIRDEAAAARMSIDMLGRLDVGPQWRLTEVPRC